jgi:polysaccharide export outer membrane protein
LLAAGCRQGVYNAKSLPPQYTAVPLADVQSLDLAHLSTSPAGSQQIQPGDTLSVNIVTGAEEDQPVHWPVVVSDSGVADVPLIGPVNLAGRSLRSAQHIVRTAAVERGIYRNPSVAVSVAERRTNSVTVVGAVAKPGTYDLPAAGSDLLSAIVAAGGLAEDANSIVEIRRAPRQDLPPPSAADGSFMAAASYPPAGGLPSAGVPPATSRIDLTHAAQFPMRGSYHLHDGDVVTVHRQPTRHVHVIGLVQRPDSFELAAGQNVRVLDAIAMAGGLRVSIADKVLVVRQVPGQLKPVVIKVSLRQAKKDSLANLLLAEGDVVSVEETPVTFVVGTIQQVIRVGVNGSVATL